MDDTDFCFRFTFSTEDFIAPHAQEELDLYLKEAKKTNSILNEKQKKKTNQQPNLIVHEEAEDPTIIDEEEYLQAAKRCIAIERKIKEKEEEENKKYGTNEQIIDLHYDKEKDEKRRKYFLSLKRPITLGGAPKALCWNNEEHDRPYEFTDNNNDSLLEVYLGKEEYEEFKSRRENDEDDKEFKSLFHPTFEAEPGYVVHNETGSYILSRVIETLSRKRCVYVYKPSATNEVPLKGVSSMNVPNGAENHTFKTYMNWNIVSFSARKLLSGYDPAENSNFSKDTMEEICNKGAPWPLGTLLVSKKYGIEFPATLYYKNQFGFALDLGLYHTCGNDGINDTTSFSLSKSGIQILNNCLFFMYQEAPHFEICNDPFKKPFAPAKPTNAPKKQQTQKTKRQPSTPKKITITDSSSPTIPVSTLPKIAVDMPRPRNETENEATTPAQIVIAPKAAGESSIKIVFGETNISQVTKTKRAQKTSSTRSNTTRKGSRKPITRTTIADLGF